MTRWCLLSTQALVKVRVCPECAIKLNWKREKEFRKAQVNEQLNMHLA